MPELAKVQKERFAGEYVEEYEKLPDIRLRRLLPLLDLSKSDVVCDYACGNGRLYELIHDKVKMYYGVDYSIDFIRAAVRRAERLNVHNYKFECSDIEPFCRRYMNTFDKSFAFDFTGYLDEEEFVRIMNSVKNSLKEGGKLYIYIPDGDYIVELIKNTRLYRHVFPKYVPVINRMTGRDYLRTLDSIGFKNIALQYLPHYNSLRYFNCMARIPLVGQMFRARMFIECQR